MCSEATFFAAWHSARQEAFPNWGYLTGDLACPVPNASEPFGRTVDLMSIDPTPILDHDAPASTYTPGPICLARVSGLEIVCRCGLENSPGMAGKPCGVAQGVVWKSRVEQIQELLDYAASVHASAGRLVLDGKDISGGAALARSRRGRAFRVEEVAYALAQLPLDVDAEEVGHILSTDVDIDVALRRLRSVSQGFSGKQLVESRKEAVQEIIDGAAHDGAARTLLSVQLSEIPHA